MEDTPFEYARRWGFVRGIRVLEEKRMGTE